MPETDWLVEEWETVELEGREETQKDDAGSRKGHEKGKGRELRELPVKGLLVTGEE